MRDVPSGAVLRFGSFRLDIGRAALLGPAGAGVPLCPRSFDVLRHLVENAGRVVSRDELLDAVWRGVIVTEDSVTQCVAEVRHALGRDAEGMLRTVPRRGYLFDAAVTPVASAEPVSQAAEPARLPTGGQAPEARPRLGLPLPNLPSVAVLPFAGIGGDAAQHHLAEGFADEIITALARLHGLFVIARDSSFAYGDRGVDVRAVGRELGVRYVLGGSVHPEAGRVRIAGRLVEAETGRHVWADRFEGDLGEVLALQDRVAEAVAGAVEPSLRRAEIVRAQAKPTESLEAYDLYLRALAQANANTRAGLDAALDLVRRALALDPDYVLAKAFGAWCCIRRFNERVAGAEEAGLALAWAQEAAAARDDAVAQAWAGHAIARFGLDLDQARGCTGRAVALCPGSALVLTQSAWVLTYCGEVGAAIEQFSRALRLNPLDPEVDAASGLGMAQLAAGKDEAALGSAMLGVRDARPHGTAFRVAIVALVRLGRLAEARAKTERFMRLFPAFRIRRQGYMPHFHNRGFVAGYVDALLRAGMPEGADGPRDAPPTKTLGN
jgi:TolB-like protein